MQQLMLNTSADSTLIEKGYPWIFRGQIAATSVLDLADPGDLMQILTPKGKPLGIAYVNPNTTLAARMLTRNPDEAVDEKFFAYRFRKAIARRQKIFSVPYYRLVFSEGDHLPGLVVDRFGNYLSCQVTTAGMSRLMVYWLPALKEATGVPNLVVDVGGGMAEREGIHAHTDIIGTIPDEVPVEENGCTFFASLRDGQKTGWFYDQRANHAFLAGHARNKTFLDVYSHSGGFGITAAKRGAERVEMVDSSALALSLAEKAALVNDVEDRCAYHHGKAFEVLADLAAQGRRYNIVVADPPPFAKTKQDVPAGLKGYSKLVRLCLPLVTTGGLFAIASCSHHVNVQALRKAVREGGCQGKEIYTAGADKDHPAHPQLPESRYLKFLVYQM